jgi:hypothetical protein
MASIEALGPPLLDATLGPADADTAAECLSGKKSSSCAVTREGVVAFLTNAQAADMHELQGLIQPRIGRERRERTMTG